MTNLQELVLIDYLDDWYEKHNSECGPIIPDYHPEGQTVAEFYGFV